MDNVENYSLVEENLCQLSSGVKGRYGRIHQVGKMSFCDKIMQKAD